MKILIMGFTKLKYMPYMNFYLENIDRSQNDVHILYWNRDLKAEDTSKYGDVRLHEFACYQEDEVSKLSKLGSFAKYRKYALKLIKDEAFDFIYVLHSLTGVLVADILKKRYKDRYVFDYRDSTYEGFAPFKKIVAQLTLNARATFVSSDAFRQLLPSTAAEKTYTSHNLLTDSLRHREAKTEQGVPSDKIRIAFWGYIRHEEINRVLIEKIAADDRFELHYYGREQQVALSLKAYAAEIRAGNVFFHGEYVPEERYGFVGRTDLLHNIYYDANTMLAMGNKYYDGAIFRIPQLCMKGSFMGDCVTRTGIGLACDPYEEGFTETLYAYYTSLNVEAFQRACDIETERVISEYENGCRIVKGTASAAAEH